MRKIIALVVAASAISGTAMADSGVFQFGGVLMPEAKVHNLWKVKIASGMLDTNTTVVKGNTTDIHIAVPKPTPLLSIHSMGDEPIKNSVAKGARAEIGLTPIISYGASLDLDNGFDNSVIPIKLELQDDKGTKIGSLTAHMFAYGETIINSVNGKNTERPQRTFLVAHKDDVFFGGLPTNNGGNIDAHDGLSRISKLEPSVLEQYDPSLKLPTWTKNLNMKEASETDPNLLFSAVYCSGFEQGASIDLKLDSPMSNGKALSWRAMLPVTVSYM